MRNIFASLFVLFLLTGCFSFSPRAYDPVEYDYVVSTTVDVTRAIHRCNDENKTDFWKFFQNVNTDTFKLVEFVKNKPDSDNVLVAAIEIRNMTTDVLNNPNFSNQYCVHKLSNIQASARILSIALGKPNSMSLCQGDIKSRYELFNASFKANKITQKEYKNLFEDLLKLENVDTSSCDHTNKQKMLEGLQLLKSVLPSIVGL